jgi:hypothetical protein
VPVHVKQGTPAMVQQGQAIRKPNNYLNLARLFTQTPYLVLQVIRYMVRSILAFHQPLYKLYKPQKYTIPS